jgi:Fe-S-cluster containining protein
MIEIGSPCLECCNGACCRNVVLINVTAEERSRLPKTAAQQPTIDVVLDMVFQRPAPKGVYFVTDAEGMSVVGIKGNCPNLLPNGKCGSYDIRPDACRNLTVGGQICNSARKEAGLRPLE